MTDPRDLLRDLQALREALRAHEDALLLEVADKLAGAAEKLLEASKRLEDSGGWVGHEESAKHPGVSPDAERSVPKDKRRRYVTVQEAADHLSIGHTAAYELVATGKLKAKRFGKRNIRVHVDELERYERDADWKAGE